MISSLKFEKDENDKEYLIITPETQQKNHHGGLNAKTGISMNGQCIWGFLHFCKYQA
jgi:hypothetical protein